MLETSGSDFRVIFAETIMNKPRPRKEELRRLLIRMKQFRNYSRADMDVIQERALLPVVAKPKTAAYRSNRYGGRVIRTVAVPGSRSTTLPWRDASHAGGNTLASSRYVTDDHCPNDYNHLMSMYERVRKEGRCDGCRKKILKGHTCGHCRQCNKWFCLFCISKPRS